MADFKLNYDKSWLSNASKLPSPSSALSYNFGNSAVMKSFWLVQGCLLVLSTNWKKSQIARNEDL